MRINYKVLQSNVSEDNLRPPHMEKDQKAFNCQANKKPAHALFRYNRPVLRGRHTKGGKTRALGLPCICALRYGRLWPAWGWLAGLWGLQPGWSHVCQAIHLPTQPRWCRGRAVETSTSPAFCWWRGTGVFSELLPKWGEQQGRPDWSWDQLEITIDENWVQCSWNLNKDSGEVSILWIPACSQCFHEGKILRSGQVSGEAVLFHKRACSENPPREDRIWPGRMGGRRGSVWPTDGGGTQSVQHPALVCGEPNQNSQFH